MAGETTSTTEISCPHCHKSFRPRLLASGTERLRGYKCPHCKLFLPQDRAEDAPLSRSGDEDS